MTPGSSLCALLLNLNGRFRLFGLGNTQRSVLLRMPVASESSALGQGCLRRLASRLARTIIRSESGRAGHALRKRARQPDHKVAAKTVAATVARAKTRRKSGKTETS